MILSIYDVTVPALLRGFDVLSLYIDRAAASAVEGGFDGGNLVQARLYPDMQSFAGQIQRASDTAKASITRLTGIEAPSFPDNEVTLADLKARIDKTTAFIGKVPQDAFADSAGRSIEIRFRAGAVTYTGTSYVLTFLLPNFYFHVTTAHDILRHNGVKIGKRDYLGAQG